ncbi:MAG: hypothetical protein H6810_03710 [Phycisphaeraceae bacterium]|nr:MAG: hypothetical protein H6810_03710 [Phycisphaeraceae bacterium]
MKTAQSLAVAALSLCAGMAAHADVFQRAQGDARREQAYSIDRTFDGGYVTAGFRDYGTAASPNEDVLVTKHNADGTIAWQRRWAGPGRDIGYSVQQTFDGGYVIAAESTSSPDPMVQILLLRLDATGTLMWNRFYFGTFMTDPINFPQPGVALDQGNNGQIYVTGNMLGRPLILNVGPGGAPIWNAFYADPITDPDIAARFAFTDIKMDPTNGTLVVSGTTVRNEPTPPSGAVIQTQDAFLLRVDGAGAPMWVWNYDFPADLDPTSEAGYNVRETGDGLDISPSGRIILNGRTDFGGPGVVPGTHLVAVDPGGFVLWGREYSFFSPDGITPFVSPGYAAVRYDNDMNIIQAGTNRSFGPEHAVEWRTDVVGTPQWMWAYGVSNVSHGESVVPDFDCGYAMTGRFDFATPPPPFAFGETYVVKNNDAGETGCDELEWSFTADFDALNKQNGIAPDYLVKMIDAPALLIDTTADDDALCYSAGCDPTPCPCDLNGDGILDIVDIGAFITCFTGSLPCGDLAPAYGVWDIVDINAFITCFLGGC